MKWLSKRRQIAMMLAPALLVFTLYFAYPIVYSLFQSFTDAEAFGSTTLVGLDNYSRMMGDALFWNSLRNTGIILVIALLVLLPGAFALAYLLSRRVRGDGVMRAMIFSPNVVAPILIGLIWVFILDPHIGLLNALLRAAGWANPPEWLGGTTLSPYSIGIVYVWQTLGFIMTIFYAGIRMLPPDVMEAAAIDGASGWKKLRYVTIPMLQETVGITTVLVVTGAFKIFELVIQLTGGGPVHLSETLVSYTYHVTFGIQKYGYGMALAVVTSLFGVAVALGYLAFLRRRRNA